MPRIYLDTDSFLMTPEALTFPVQVARLQKNESALDRLLAQASKRVDVFCHKKIGAPGQTRIATGGLSSGSTSVNVDSTLMFDGDREQAVRIGSEILPLLPGGVEVSSWISPYPGVLRLASPVQGNYSAGTTVSGCYQEISTVGSSSSNDDDLMVDMSQEAQLAEAHNGGFSDSGNLTRIIFLKQYPIVKFYKLEHQLPYSTGQYGDLGINDIGIQPGAGYIRLPLGSYVLEKGLMRITYLAGYQSIPDDIIARATAFYMADSLQNMVSMGAYEMSQGKLRGKYADSQSAKSRYVAMAEEILCQGNYVRQV